MLFMYSFASFFPEIHLHTPMMTCLGFVFISWASSFFIFSRGGRELYRILIGEVNVESTNDLGLVTRWVLVGVM